MSNMQADGHLNLTWYCPYCEKRNRAHVQLGSDVQTSSCDECGGEADIFPATVVVYSSPLIGEVEVVRRAG